jgi:DNA modification methylase
MDQLLDTILNVDCLDGFKKVKDESVDLVIADPPYFKVAHETWDYKFSTLDKYIEWSTSYFKEIFRVLRKGGSFYLFGYFRILAYLVPELEKTGFELRQQIIIDKGIKAVSGRATKKYKMFPNTTESVLFLAKDSKPYVKQLLLSRQKELGLKSKEINEKLGVKTNGGGMWSIYTGDNMDKQLPTEDAWKDLCRILKLDVPYKSFAMIFHPIMGLHDVWTDIDFYKEKRIHSTQKPVKLISRLILASSDPGDLVLDPFMGSGSTAIAAKENQRHFIGFEIDKDYYKKSMERINDFSVQEKLF